MKSPDESFKALLRDYVDAFVARISSSNISQTPIPVAPELANKCEDLGIWLKTSFGHGNLAAIPWLGCFAPGQSAQYVGVYPTVPTQPSYLVFDIELATDFADYTCNFAALQGKPAKVALGHPFATSLIDVLIARKPKLP